jgi:hypothetical protein
MRWKSQATFGVKFNATIVGQQCHGLVESNALAVVNAQSVRNHIGFKGAFAVMGQVLNNSVSKSAWHKLSLSVKWFVDASRESGHFFLRRKLPWPRPTRDGCTALEAMCCLVDAAERGALLDELSLEAEDDFSPDEVDFAVVVAFELALEPPPDSLAEVAPRLADEFDSPPEFEVDALDFPSLLAPTAPLVAPDFASDFASVFAGPAAVVFESPVPAFVPEASCDDLRSASAALV